MQKFILNQKKLKNIEYSEIVSYKNMIDVRSGEVVSKTLVQNKSVGITLFAFDKGEGISSHKSDGDAIVTCLEGVGCITINDKEYIIKEGETIVMPSKIYHAVKGVETFKMLLVVVF